MDTKTHNQPRRSYYIERCSGVARGIVEEDPRPNGRADSFPSIFCYRHRVGKASMATAGVALCPISPFQGDADAGQPGRLGQKP